MRGVRLACPAKINLTLEILGRRSDGYHELRTIFQAVSLYDNLWIERAREDVLLVEGPWPAVPNDERNLCWHALSAFRERFGWQQPVVVRLEKRIPPAAGLGGGSSDAAGMLRGLAHLAGLKEPLETLACQLGSDVPFFLRGGACLGAGRGEQLEPLPALREGVFVLAMGKTGMSTTEAYRLITPRDYTDGVYTERMKRLLQAEYALPEIAQAMYNVFATPVERKQPAIAFLRQELLEHKPLTVMLCGSGAAVMGLWAEAEKATATVAALREAGYWAEMARPLAEGPCVEEF